MKKLASFSLFLFLLIGLLNAQGTNVMIEVSGRITVANTTTGAANQAAEIILSDSSSSNILMQGQYATDSAGYYSFSNTFFFLPGPVRVDVHVIDCNGMILTQQFTCNLSTCSYSNVDFSICQNMTGSCYAGFMAGTSSGSTTVNFLDFSTSTTGPIVSRLWDFGDGNTGTTQNPQHIYASTGTYQVCISIMSMAGCSATFCDSVTVGSSGGSCQSSLSYGNLTSGAVAFVATGASNAAVVGYTYDFGNGNTLSTVDDTVYYAYNAFGQFNACVTAYFSDSCSSTSCITVTIPNAAPCQANFFSIPDTTGQYTLILVNNSTGNNLTYDWDFGDGDSATLAYPTHTYSGPGTYNICLTVSDSANNCTSTFCDSITVLNKINAAFTINVIPFIDVAIAPVQSGIATATLYPNPTHEKMNLRLTLLKPGLAFVEIFDLQSRIVGSISTQRLSAGAHEIALATEELPFGIYYARIAVGGEVRVLKVVVE